MSVRPRVAAPTVGAAFAWKELSYPMDRDDFDIGPSDVELAAIELEWPMIAAEMDIVEAEARLLTAEHGLTDLDWRRLRRAERRRLRALVELLDLTAAVLCPEHEREAVAS